MTVAFKLSTLRCACGSADVMCVDPGSDGQIDLFSDIMLQRGVSARGWCIGCFTAFAALIPHEKERKRYDS